MYVDDFRMAGKKENLAPMWKILRKDLELEDSVPSHTNTYLGCNQRNIKIDNTLVNEKDAMFTRLINPSEGQSCEQDKRDAINSHDAAQRLQDPSSLSNEAISKMKPNQKKSTNQTLADSRGSPLAVSPASALSNAAATSSTKTKQFQGEIRAWAYDMKEHSEQCVQR